MTIRLQGILFQQLVCSPLQQLKRYRKRYTSVYPLQCLIKTEDRMLWIPLRSKIPLCICPFISQTDVIILLIDGRRFIIYRLCSCCNVLQLCLAFSFFCDHFLEIFSSFSIIFYFIIIDVCFCQLTCSIVVILLVMMIYLFIILLYHYIVILLFYFILFFSFYYLVNS